MSDKSDNRRLPLLWRTILLLTLSVVISQMIIYAWVQRSVQGHFEEMDAEIITHAAFNWRQRLTDIEQQSSSSDSLDLLKLSAPIDTDHLHSSWLDYDLKIIIADQKGQPLSSTPRGFANQLGADFNLLTLKRDNGEQQFVLEINDRRYRAIVIENAQLLILIALPIDVHHHYLLQFNRQLGLILFAITLLLVSIAALSVYWGFAPLSTIMQKMKGISPEKLDERLHVNEMPRELRPLAESYNLMMAKLENNFESLSRFSDNIAHELRTPLATLSTQTQVMLSKPRDSEEYIEQLHHQHDTLEQLSSLINNMLLLVKTEKGLNDSQLNAVNTEALLVKLIDYFELIAEERQIIIKKSGEFTALLGDEILLKRLFANLISNAIYYAASNSTITIATVRTMATSTATTITTNDALNHNHTVVNERHQQTSQPFQKSYSNLSKYILQIDLMFSFCFIVTRYFSFET